MFRSHSICQRLFRESLQSFHENFIKYIKHTNKATHTRVHKLENSSLIAFFNVIYIKSLGVKSFSQIIFSKLHCTFLFEGICDHLFRFDKNATNLVKQHWPLITAYWPLSNLSFGISVLPLVLASASSLPKK